MRINLIIIKNKITKISVLSILSVLFLISIEANSAQNIKSRKLNEPTTRTAYEAGSLNLYGLPCPLYELAEIQGIFYPKITATPWVLISKTEEINNLKNRLFNELKEQIPQAKISGYRIENITVSEYIQNLQLKSTNTNQSQTVTSDKGIAFLKFNNKELTKEIEASENQMVSKFEQNFVMTRFVLEFIHISEADILKLKAAHANNFMTTSKEIRDAIDEIINVNYLPFRSNQPIRKSYGSDLLNLLMKFKDLAVSSYYSARQEGLTNLQASEIYYLYFERVHNVEILINKIRQIHKDSANKPEVIKRTDRASGDEEAFMIFDEQRFKSLRDVPKLNE